MIRCHLHSCHLTTTMSFTALGDDILLDILSLGDLYTVLAVSEVSTCDFCLETRSLNLPAHQASTGAHTSEAIVAVFDSRYRFPRHPRTSSFHPR
ncbi:hypothetical protein B0H12DRAFT_1125110 [Mycena haematopus]|nr:hypothetical protein B0H12DRAFT_1125110 [Mycena haematopus]